MSGDNACKVSISVSIFQVLATTTSSMGDAPLHDFLHPELAAISKVLTLLKTGRRDGFYYTGAADLLDGRFVKSGGSYHILRTEALAMEFVRLCDVILTTF